MSTISDLLRNYLQLRKNVDRICRDIATAFGPHLACRAGCDGCCRQITLFPVEADALAAGLAALPEEQAGHIRNRVRTAPPDGPCPLLEDGLCLLYDHRPIICRTHGLPLLLETDGSRQVDFCPLNFQGLPSLPGNAVIDLDRLNEALAAVNSLFVAELADGAQREKERVSIAEALIHPLTSTQPE